MSRLSGIRTIDALFDAAFNDLVRTTLDPVTSTRWVPAANIMRDKETISIVMDVPGIRPQDLAINLEQQTLTVTGTRHRPASDDTAQTTWSEIPYGTFSRTFQLPAGVTSENVSAAHADGVLTITVKPTRPAVQSISITTGASTGSAAEITA